MSEQVNHPSHYQGKIEVIEFLEDQFMNRPHEWNAVKYLSRAGKKNPDKEIEDLEKAIWYIRRKIELLSAEKFGQIPRKPNDMNPVDPVTLETWMCGTNGCIARFMFPKAQHEMQCPKCHFTHKRNNDS